MPGATSSVSPISRFRRNRAALLQTQHLADSPVKGRLRQGYAWLSHAERFFRGEDLEFLKTLLWWEFTVASVCIAGLVWWLRDFLRANMDPGILLPFLSPNFLIAFCALGWLFIRLRKVLSTPVDDLVRILGLEVPAPPEASLIDITHTGVTVHWKPPEQRNSIAKYAVRINGFVAGEVSHQDNAVVISGLLPGRCYTIRIVAINSSNFQASSEAIRIKTIENESDHNSSISKPQSSDPDAESSSRSSNAAPAPTVTPCKAFPDTLVPTAATPMVREVSGNHIQPKRQSNSKRSAPSLQSSNRGPSRDRHKEAETIQALNAKLDVIRTQLQEQEKQDEEEELEFQSGQAALKTQRDTLKRQLKERDDETKDLNKSVKSLEHANSAAQNKKMQQERLLNEKLRAREKMHEDVARWDSEVPNLEAEAENLARQKDEVLEASEKAVREIREEQKPDLQALAFIEEQIQERGKEIQELDREKKRLEESPEFLEAADRNQEFVAENREWSERLASLQTQLNSAMTACYQAQANFAQTQQRFDLLNAQRGGQVNGFSSAYPTENTLPTADAVQSLPPNPGMRVNFELPEPRSNFSTLHNRNTTGSSNSYRTSSPFLTSASTIPLPSRPQNDQELSIETLTGGALTSPNAGDLLPSDLLGDDTDDNSEPRARDLPQRFERTTRSRPTSTASRPLSANFGRPNDGLATEPDYLPGLGAIPGLGIGEAANAAPDSPAGSFASVSPSAVSSPHSSLGNLHQNRGSEGNIESDRRSIRSASGSSRNFPVSRRFDFFGRQRGKTTTEEGPILGSLKSEQSRSMPRDSETGNSPVGARPAPKPSGGLFGQMSSAVLGRRTAASNAPAEANETASLGRTGSISSFSSAPNPWARSLIGRRASASRPGSTYSTENALPAPSVYSPRFGWGVSKESLHRGTNVHSGPGLSNPWSPIGSRRPSVQQDTANASIWEIGDAEDDSDAKSDDSSSPPPAPIGTKPKRSVDPNLAKELNPAARDFTTMFSFGRRGDKADKENSKTKKKAQSPLAGDPASNTPADDSSPPASRKSRDTLLSSTAGSFDELRPEEQADGTTSTSQENTAHPSPSGRDSLMKILSRKGSSGKFSLPTRKDKTGLFSRKANQAEETEDDSGSSAKLGKSIESITSSPQAAADKRPSGFSLPSFKKKAKKGSSAPSISDTSMTSGASMTSGTGDEDDGRESIDEEVEFATP